MLTITNWQLLSPSERALCLSRPVETDSVKNKVLEIIQQVQTTGDQALFELTRKLDGACLKQLKVPQQKIQDATIDQHVLSTMNQAIQTITNYHQSLIPEEKSICTAQGIHILTTYRPIQKVGLYVPGGNKTPLISSLLMQAIPARIAGCPIKVLCTPPDANGEINPHLLVAARLCGIETIYTLGGAQAIAAMAYGTESVTKVDKLFGPGNRYVTEAKSLVSIDPCGAAADMPAGPSEVMIIADNHANPSFVAADLLAQAEHGADSQVILICENSEFANEVNQEIQLQSVHLSRSSIINQSLAKSRIIVCSNSTEQLAIINNYAPEHLIINRDDADSWVSHINSAGTVFLGSWAAETMGDYVSGSNHVLPTNGYAKNHNGLSTLDFLTRFNVQSINQEGIKNLGPAAVCLAQIEGLDAHANAIQIRLNALEA
ncbi:histidinol dehydrogenase [Legionella quateirensis]|uniref:Histidinol dehydrogenase n=1 Tax=Legionella quateirensis TaxID=45072 RepID=A0A378KXV4_9GAMM|nr:histidinol dehydrogenase [Legionella quateirensis]KTD43318.1 histidinol dehydrogenase [Legionella quateirensis]STY18198.1 histidinol dehydrogenase [Legionella quateirensis]